MHPDFVHGGGITTCGSPACDTAEMLRFREKIIAANLKHGLSAEVVITALQPDEVASEVACGNHSHATSAVELRQGTTSNAVFSQVSAILNPRAGLGFHLGITVG
jgi:hypothetical protein